MSHMDIANVRPVAEASQGQAAQDDTRESDE